MKKILIIGGCSQGKTAFAKKNFKEYNIDLSSYDSFMQRLMETSIDKTDDDINNDTYDNMDDNINNYIYDDKQGFFIDNFHILMKNMLDNNAGYKMLVTKLVQKKGWLVISDEIGCGLVPIEACDRRWREETGRMLTLIADHSDEVYRIFSGIAQRIK